MASRSLKPIRPKTWRTWAARFSQPWTPARKIFQAPPNHPNDKRMGEPLLTRYLWQCMQRGKQCRLLLADEQTRLVVSEKYIVHSTTRTRIYRQLSIQTYIVLKHFYSSYIFILDYNSISTYVYLICIYILLYYSIICIHHLYYIYIYLPGDQLHQHPQFHAMWKHRIPRPAPSVGHLHPPGGITGF